MLDNGLIESLKFDLYDFLLKYKPWNKSSCAKILFHDVISAKYLLYEIKKGDKNVLTIQKSI